MNEKIKVDLDKNFTEDSAFVVSVGNKQRHIAWLVGNMQVISAEYSYENGLGIFVYISFEEYLEEYQNTWVLKNNQTDSLGRICETFNLELNDYIGEE